MKKWRVGSISMALFLIFLGVTLLAAQFRPELGANLIRYCWSFLLVILGVEILASLYFLRKGDVRYGYDFLSFLFVGLIGLISLGVYGLQSVGLWDRMTLAVNGVVVPLERQVEVIPRGKVDKVLLNGEFFRGKVRLWDSADGKVRATVSGYSYDHKERPTWNEQALAPVLTAGQYGSVIQLRLRRPFEAGFWTPRADAVDIQVPPFLTVEIEAPDLLDVQTGEFHGKIVGLDSGP